MDLFHLEEALTGEFGLVLCNNLPPCPHVQLLYGFLLPAPLIFDMDQADEIPVRKVRSYVTAIISGNSSGNMVFRIFLKVKRTHFIQNGRKYGVRAPVYPGRVVHKFPGRNIHLVIIIVLDERIQKKFEHTADRNVRITARIT